VATIERMQPITRLFALDSELPRQVAACNVNIMTMQRRLGRYCLRVYDPLNSSENERLITPLEVKQRRIREVGHGPRTAEEMRRIRKLDEEAACTTELAALIHNCELCAAEMPEYLRKIEK